MKNLISILLSIACIVITLPVSATIYHVRTDGDDNHSGITWDQSFRTLRKALSVLEQGDQVWVAEGTYFPDEGPGATDNDRYAYFAIPPKSETILGGFPPSGNPELSDRDWVTYPCILSGDIDQSGTLANNSRTVVRVLGALSFDEITPGHYFRNFDGFTITGGYVASDDEIETLFNDIDASGAGMDIYGYTDNYNIRNCRFIDNHAMADGCAGGGLFMYSSLSDVFHIQNCIFAGNEAVVGGAMAFKDSNAELRHCTVYNNHAYQSGVSWSTPGCSYINSIFWGNTTVVATNFTPSYSGNPSTGFFVFNLMDDGPDPLFIDPDNNDFRLQPCSPAIDAVSLAWSDQGQLPPTDYYLNPRPVDGNGDGNATSDIGVYEMPADSPQPGVVCQDVTIALDEDGFASVLAEDLDNGSEFCSSVTFDIALSGSGDFGTAVNFDCGDIGAHTVTLRATDSGSAVATCEATVTVIDDSAPVIACQNAIITISANGPNEIQESDVLDALNSYDNCGYSILNLPMSVDCNAASQGTLQVTLIASDASGNTSTCVAEVTVETESAFPSSWGQESIGNSIGNAEYDLCDGSFVVTGTGVASSTSDKEYLVYQDICGDFEFIVHVNGIDNPGWAGIEIRESLDPNSKKLTIKTQLTSIVWQYARKKTAAPATLSVNYRPGHKWLKLVRNNNTITTYSSANGSSWTYFSATLIPFATCAKVGMYAESQSQTIPTTAYFDYVSLNSSGMQFAVMNPGSPSLANPVQESIDLSVYPNPFSESATINMDIPDQENVTLEIYDAQGQLVSRMLAGEKLEGRNAVQLDAQGMLSGMYVVRLSTAKEVVSRRIVVSE